MTNPLDYWLEGSPLTDFGKKAGNFSAWDEGAPVVVLGGDGSTPSGGARSYCPIILS